MCLDVAIDVVKDLISYVRDVSGPRHKEGLLHDKSFEEYSYTKWALNEVLERLEEAKQHNECPYGVLSWLSQSSFEHYNNHGEIMFSVMRDVLDYIIDELNCEIGCTECEECKECCE